MGPVDDVTLTSLPAPRPRLAAIARLPGAWRGIGALVKGVRWQWELRRSGLLKRGVEGLCAEGNEQLERISWRERGQPKSVKADMLLVHEGVAPRIPETLALGCA